MGGLGELGIIEAAGQFVPYGVVLLLFAGLTATMSALNATVYSSSRVSFAMGRDRALPRIFQRIHAERRTPHWAILLSAVFIAVMAVALPIEAVAASADIMFILLFVQVNWTLIRMRKTHPDLPRTYEVPYLPWPPLIGIGLQVLLLPFLVYALGLEAFGIGTSNHGLFALGATAVWMTLGLVVYYAYSRPKEAEKREAETPTVLEERAPVEREERVLVPIANPDNATQLLRTGIDMARDREAELEVMTVVTVPHQTPLSEGRAFVDEQRGLIDDAVDYVERTAPDLPVNGTIRIGHDVSRAIHNTIEQHAVDLVVMGWRSRGRRTDYVLGSNVDDVVLNGHCDVLVERIGPAGEIDSILVPTAGGPHAAFAAEVAAAIARETGAAIELLYVRSPDDDEGDAETRLESARAVIDDGELVVSTTVVGSDAVAEAIVERTADHDLTVIGSSRESLLSQLVFGAIPETVGRGAESTVIMAKRNLGLVSRLTRWLRNERT
nr:amino acid permease [Halorhabdus amylolytica]